MNNYLSNLVDVDYLCQLSHLDLSPQEKESIEKDIQKIIKFFDKIQELDLNNEEYFYHYQLGETKYSQDQHTKIEIDEFLSLNSVSEEKYFKIPPILKK
jgi:aspartyl-tRNA(Asn)/glutamyl-tRNA(Gln) amidotransferase subunit C